MTKISFRSSNSEFGDFVEMTSSMNVKIDDFLKFAKSQFPHMCGPINVEQSGFEMIYENGEWRAYRML